MLRRGSRPPLRSDESLIGLAGRFPPVEREAVDTCLVIVALAILMLRGRTFGLGTAVSMFAVAVVAIVSGFARPALLAHAEEELVVSLGLPTENGASDVWFSPTPPLWDFSDWPLVVLGLLLALGGWVIVRARQLRLDLEATT